MSRGPWMRIDPDVHLKGATPETLARALLRPLKPLRPRPEKKAGARTSVSKSRSAAKGHAS